MTMHPYESIRVARYFTAAEFACRCEHHTRNAAQIQPPIMSPYLLAGLDWLRMELGAPIIITSGWRCAAHNEAVGGQTQSLHLVGLAADITVPACNTADVLAAIQRCQVFGYHYCGGNWFHVDARRDNRNGCITRDSDGFWITP